MQRVPSLEPMSFHTNTVRKLLLFFSSESGKLDVELKYKGSEQTCRKMVTVERGDNN